MYFSACMTPQGVNRIQVFVKVSHSDAFKAMSQDEKHMVLSAWTVMLRDIPADIVMLAVMQIHLARTSFLQQNGGISTYEIEA
ncbi:MAG: hypothetical protein ACI3W5_10600 [Faecousia sp.]